MKIVKTEQKEQQVSRWEYYTFDYEWYLDSDFDYPHWEKYISNKKIFNTFSDLFSFLQQLKKKKNFPTNTILKINQIYFYSSVFE